MKKISFQTISAINWKKTDKLAPVVPLIVKEVYLSKKFNKMKLIEEFEKMDAKVQWHRLLLHMHRDMQQRKII